MPQGLCRDKRDDITSNAWSCDEKGRVVIAGVQIPAVRAQQMAADICFNCPVQWSCTRFYLEGDERAGVWGMTPRDMKKFRDTCRIYGVDELKMVDAAELEQIPVQVMVRKLMASV